ncbi:DUF2269 domain-containing protein [Porticoccus sp. W117]|uniref:DUF2269 family protein n=1 Tax=Porticoccus sp. W117 TaxID=3054777 RepID=UPI00259A3F04|nr:DUF2269 domain-containing protein [Porticoccus sp. W117]MDM3870746.1 DUF2269 domain-containing protein [Porticoccus sp. W117]
MNIYLVVKTLHILSSTILFGTGIGIAFFMFRSMRTNNLHEKFYAAKNTVLADCLFTLPAVIIQPLSGIALIYLVGYNWNDFWLTTTYIIYILVGLCWLPVVWIQIQLKRMVAVAIETEEQLPQRYYRLFKLWCALGWPGFIGLMAVFYLMVAKPI